MTDPEFSLDDSINHFVKNIKDIEGDSHSQTIFQTIANIARLVNYDENFNQEQLAKVIALSRKQLNTEERITLKRIIELIIVNENKSWGDEVEDENQWQETIKKMVKREKKHIQLETIEKKYYYSSIDDVFEMNKIDDPEVKEVIAKALKSYEPYKAKPCKFLVCRKGKLCPFAHTREEIVQFRGFNSAKTRERLGFPYPPI